MQPVFMESGPWRGMRDSLDASSADPNLASLLQNVYPVDSERGTVVVGRPGFQIAQSVLTGGDMAQLIYQFTKLDGTEITVAIADGRIFTFDWGTREWLQSVEDPDFVTAGITISKTTRCYAATFADKMVVSDGVNTPFTWNGTAGSSGLTKLTNCPVLFGQPTVYYAKLFGIKNAARTTIVWSEENDPTSGYDSGSFTNAWQLGQTDQEPLYALVGTNGALYYFRARSIGVISGAVNADFVTSGVHDAVSGTVGTQSPDCTVYYEGRIYFVDATYKPHVIVPGSGVVPLWGDVQETLLGLDLQYANRSVGVYDVSTGHILLGVVELSQTFPSLQIVIDPQQGAGQVVALWRGFTYTTMVTVKNASGQPVLMHLSEGRYPYDHGYPDGTLWSDATVEFTPDLPIEHIVIPSAMGNDVSIEKRFDRIDMNFRTPSDLTGVSVSYQTSRGTSTAQTLPDVTGNFSRWGIAVWDVDRWSSPSYDQHVAVGINAQGRWIKPKIQHSTLGEQFALGTCRVTAYPLNNAPGNP